MEAVERASAPDVTTYTVTQTARILGIAPKTVRHWIADGRLPGFHLAADQRRWWIPCAAVDALRPAPRQKVSGPYLTLPQAREQLGVSVKTLRRWLTSGRLAGTKRGLLATDRWLIPRAEVKRIRQGGQLRLPTR